MNHFLSIRDLDRDDVGRLFRLTAELKAKVKSRERISPLGGRTMALIFEKPSLRTRLTFEAGMASLGGTAFFMDQTGGRIDARESLWDIAHNVSRWVDAIVLRTFAHSSVENMANYASIPVINALSDLEHPCQALADFSVLQERFGDLQKVTIAYLGDGNNVAHSLLLTGAMLGSHVRVATPQGYEPKAEIVRAAEEIANETGATLEILRDPHEAVAGADAVYTDAWASMGQEGEAEARVPIFQPYQVNDQLMAEAGPRAVFMHCLPAHRGQEVTDSVMDSPRSVIFDQAEGRLHVQKAVLMLLLWGGASRFPVRSAHA